MKKRIGVGVIGLHNWYHAYPFGDYLKKGTNNLALVAVSDEREKYARQFASQYGAKAWYTNYKELLKRSDVDIVIITSYTTSHAEIAVACSEAGKHMICDKPIAATMKDADAIVRAVDKNGVKFMMAYAIRFNSAYARAKELINQGAIGKPVSAFWSIRCPVSYIREAPDVDYPGWYADPRKGGAGGFLDHGVHFTDALRWYFQSEVKSVAGEIANLTYKDIQVEDFGVAILRFKSGAIATVESTWHTADWYAPLSSPELCIITGDEGEIILHYHKSPQLEYTGKLEPKKGRVYLDWGGDERYEIGYKRILEYFADCVLKNKKPIASAIDGRAALEICLAAYESAKKRQFVTLPLKRD